MEINWHIVTLFSMQYKHLLDGINHVSMLSHVKDKTVTFSMKTVYIPNIYIKVWTQKTDFPLVDFLTSFTHPEIARHIPLELTDIE